MINDDDDDDGVDDDDENEMSVSLVAETGVPGGNHQPTASNCPAPVPNPDRSGVKPGDLKCHESIVLAYSATEAPSWQGSRPICSSQDYTISVYLYIMIYMYKYDRSVLKLVMFRTVY